MFAWFSTVFSYGPCKFQFNLPKKSFLAFKISLDSDKFIIDFNLKY